MSQKESHVLFFNTHSLTQLMTCTFLWSLKDRDEDFNRIDLPCPENISLPSSLNILTPEQAIELLLLFSQNNKLKSHTTSEPITICDSDKTANESQQSTTKMEDTGSSSTESSGEFVDTDTIQIDVKTMQTVEIKNILSENVLMPTVTKSADKTNIDILIKESDLQCNESNKQIENVEPNEIDDEPKNNQTDFSASQKSDTDLARITGEICQQKFDELKQLLDDAHKAMTNIVSSQEKLNTVSEVNILEIKANDSAVACPRNTTPEHPAAPGSSSYNLDDDNRAGKYHKKPAPKAPINNETLTSNEDINESESQNALKATLVIKTGTLRTIPNADTTKDIFLAHTPDSTKRKKKSNRLRAKESFSKLLTIPKNIFHSAFHKEQNETSFKEEDSSSSFSETSGSASRSSSIGSQAFADAPAKLSTSKQEMDVEEIPLKLEYNDMTKNPNKNIYSFDAKLKTEIVSSSEAKTNDHKIENIDVGDDVKNLENFEKSEKNVENKFNLEIREMSQTSPRGGRKEIITDI